MLSKDELAGLNVGDAIEAGMIFAGLTREPVVLQVVDKFEATVRVEFVATYFGVTLGKVRAQVKGELVEWEL